MTQTNNLSEVFKTKQNFSNFIEENSSNVIKDLLEGYPNRDLHIVCPQLTQSNEGLLESVAQLQENKKTYIFWFIANEKEELKITSKKLNDYFDKNFCGIFIIKTFLNGDKIDFECVLKPEFVSKQKREINTDTPAKQLQKTFWEVYIPICDESEHPDMQIFGAFPRHYQYISIHKSGVQILQTINTVKGYVASELTISKKSVFEQLFKYKEEIEKEIGKLEWHCKENNKSTKIRKTYSIDINDTENHKKAAAEQIKMGAQLMHIAKKYL